MDEQEEAPVSRAAVVEAGVVTNVILVVQPQEDEEPFALEGCDIVLLTDDSNVGIGWLWDGEAFESPPVEEE